MERFNDAKGLLHAPKILEDVLTRLAEIEATPLDDGDDSTGAAQ